MATLHNVTALFSLTFLLLITPLSSSSSSSSSAGVEVTRTLVTENVVKDICYQSEASGICLKLMKSIPQIGKVDLEGLAQIMIHMGSNRTHQTLVRLHSLFKKTNDSVLKKRYAMCSKLYGLIFDEFKEVSTSLSNGEFTLMNQETWVAVTFAIACQDQFTHPPSDPSRVLMQGLPTHLYLLTK
ncbi:pectinesterase inhibitor-like [Tripterygium wilfordii]|uniref:pectinesterase inhibitor-like n=1 Tax=Tripterygium wilfordii TaxID=458696 RepID=UPI0018F81120|nr:pectinesterase inhibitor-like [Tripterygium wilfordii]